MMASFFFFCWKYDVSFGGVIPYDGFAWEHGQKYLLTA